jgi:hypothetical protein
MCFILGPDFVLSTLFAKIPQCLLFFQVDETKFHTRTKQEVEEDRNCLITVLVFEAWSLCIRNWKI